MEGTNHCLGRISNSVGPLKSSYHSEQPYVTRFGTQSVSASCIANRPCHGIMVLGMYG